jgi:hypothetical protein
MAKPAFIYAFDNLGPHRFAELCGALLGSRYKGFGFYVLGGVGPDGGVDAELDTNLGIWQPESEDALLNDIIRPGKTVVFQFKHKVVVRAGGQAKARAQLLRLYKCREGYTCELHRQLIIKRNPTDYVLVTNVEVNSQFRSKFIGRCRSENPEIEHYQIIGLDELEAWVTMETRLRHLYFPTIFGPPQFDLRVFLSKGFADFYDDGSIFISYGDRPTHLYDSSRPGDRLVDLLQVSVLNVGTLTSYVSSIGFQFIVNGEKRLFLWEEAYKEAFPEMKSLKSPKLGTPLEPGRRHVFRFPFYVIREITKNVKDAFPVQVLVYDEVGNIYGTAIPKELREKMK